MPNYRRIWQTGGTYFFTVNLAHRHNNDLLIRHIDQLRSAIRTVRSRHPFHIHAWVVLPEHMHCIMELPLDDSDFALSWRLIKARFSMELPADEIRNASRLRRGERGIWQRRYWEHLIRDERDFQKHMDYVHINPVKHGHVAQVADWPHSTFHRCVREGIYPVDWAG
jgi:putative transposase